MNMNLTNVYFNWEPREETEWGSQVVSRLVVAGVPWEYPRASIIAIMSDGQQTTFAASLTTKEGESYKLSTNDWAFMHQTVLMWIMRIVGVILSGDGNPGEGSSLSNWDDWNVEEILERWESSLRDDTEEGEEDSESA